MVVQVCSQHALPSSSPDCPFTVLVRLCCGSLTALVSKLQTILNAFGHGAQPRLRSHCSYSRMWRVRSKVTFGISVFSSVKKGLITLNHLLITLSHLFQVSTVKINWCLRGALDILTLTWVIHVQSSFTKLIAVLLVRLLCDMTWRCYLKELNVPVLW